MTMFDNYLMVDWSASKDPIMGENSIWLAFLVKGEFIDLEFPNPCTRHLAYKVIGNLLKKTEGRTIVGFDFPFGYPADSYDGFKCDNWAELWDLISKEIDDKPNNSNNRFEVASDFNEFFYNAGMGTPFWGHPKNRCYPHLENEAPQGYGKTLPTEFRTVEKLVKDPPRINPKSVWQLFCGVTVGSQTLMGIPVVNKLREDLDCSVWPFETINQDPKKQFVLAEIYPSIWKTIEKGRTYDERQVKTVAKNIAYLDETNTLKNLLQAPHIHSKKDDIINKEGWILGVDENGNPAQCPH